MVEASSGALSLDSIDLRTAISRVSSAYRSCAPAHRYYVAIKLRTDPLAKEVFSWSHAKGDLGVLVDVGCGRGQFSLLAGQAARIKRVFGFDHDSAKVDAGRCAAAELCDLSRSDAPRFSSDDASQHDYVKADTIFLFDVLHYLSEEEQSMLVGSLASALRPGGHLLIRETNQSGGVGAWVAAQFERFGRMLRVNRGKQLVFRMPGTLERELRTLGLEVSRSDPRGPLRNELVIANRPREL